MELIILQYRRNTQEDWQQTLIILEAKAIEQWRFEQKNNNKSKHCLKSVHIRSFSDPYFHAFGMNTFSPNARKYGPEKPQKRKNPR